MVLAIQPQLYHLSTRVGINSVDCNLVIVIVLPWFKLGYIKVCRE